MLYRYASLRLNKNKTYCVYIWTLYRNKRKTTEIIADNLPADDAFNIQHKIQPTLKVVK